MYNFVGLALFCAFFYIAYKAILSIADKLKK